MYWQNRKRNRHKWQWQIISRRSSLSVGSSLQVFTPGEEILSRIFFKQLPSMLASLSLQVQDDQPHYGALKKVQQMVATSCRACLFLLRSRQWELSNAEMAWGWLSNGLTSLGTWRHLTWFWTGHGETAGCEVLAGVSCNAPILGSAGLLNFSTRSQTLNEFSAHAWQYPSATSRVCIHISRHYIYPSSISVFGTWW